MDAVISFINENLPAFWITFGLLLMGVEIVLFGFSALVLMLAGLGAVTSGLLMMTGILPETWIAGTACMGVSSGIYGAVLWQPLKKLQNADNQPEPTRSDYTGLEFVLSGDVTPLQPGSYRYAGIDWKVEISPDSELQELSAGSRVKVVAVEVGVMKVVAV